MKKARGFTLIELMIVVAIIAILAAISFPAYQDYVARAQVSEGISLATGAKVAVATYYADTGEFPLDNDVAGMSDPLSIMGRYVESVTVDDTGTIQVLFGHESSGKIIGQTITMSATNNDGSLSWHCTGLDPRYMPSACR